MKIKKLGALLVSAALCAGMAAPAFAFEGEAAPVEQPVLPEVVEEDVVTVTDETSGALTPEGNLTLVDDYHTDYSDGSGQQFIITEAEAASYERLNHQRQNEKDLAQKAAQDAYNAKIADFETGYENFKKQFESWTVTDVKQKQGDLFAEHTFVLHGKEFSFVERDLHDLGFVINPMYRIDPDSTASGYLTCDDTGAKVWCVNGSRYIPLSEDETLCVNAICQYGKFVNSSIRM